MVKEVKCPFDEIKRYMSIDYLYAEISPDYFYRSHIWIADYHNKKFLSVEFGGEDASYINTLGVPEDFARKWAESVERSTRELCKCSKCKHGFLVERRREGFSLRYGEKRAVFKVDTADCPICQYHMVLDEIRDDIIVLKCATCGLSYTIIPHTPNIWFEVYHDMLISFARKTIRMDTVNVKIPNVNDFNWSSIVKEILGIDFDIVAWISNGILYIMPTKGRGTVIKKARQIFGERVKIVVV